jgi:hypothetical protein
MYNHRPNLSDPAAAMMPSKYLVFLCGLATLSATAVLAIPKATYSVWAADSAISRGQGNGLDSSGNPVVSYEHGEFQWALRLLFEKTGNKTYFDYIKTGVDNIVFENGTVHGSYTSVPVILF